MGIYCLLQNSVELLLRTTGRKFTSSWYLSIGSDERIDGFVGGPYRGAFDQVDDKKLDQQYGLRPAGIQSKQIRSRCLAWKSSNRPVTHQSSRAGKHKDYNFDLN